VYWLKPAGAGVAPFWPAAVSPMDERVKPNPRCVAPSNVRAADWAARPLSIDMNFLRCICICPLSTHSIQIAYSMTTQATGTKKSPIFSARRAGNCEPGDCLLNPVPAVLESAGRVLVAECQRASRASRPRPAPEGDRRSKPSYCSIPTAAPSSSRKTTAGRPRVSKATTLQPL